MATWYRTGTVALTNGGTAVTGTGTVFVANANNGDAFHAADGRVYEIASVNSNTSLTLATAYQGTTQSGLTYAIQPTRGLTVELTAAAQALLATIDDYVNTALAGRFGDGTAGAPGLTFDADPDTGLYRPAANQLAASIAGVQRWLLSAAAFNLSVPITGSAVQSAADDATAGKALLVGGFGVGAVIPPTLADLDATATPAGFYRFASTASGTFPTGEVAVDGAILVERNGASTMFQKYRGNGSNNVWTRRWNSSIGWGSWHLEFSRPNILATVAQSGGVPTGGLIERASNANGRYVRFADGTQLCSGIATLTYINSGLLSGTWTFPAAFLNASELGVTANVSAGTASFATASLDEIGAVLTGTVSASSAALQLRPHPGVTFGASDETDVLVTAIGRWI